MEKFFGEINFSLLVVAIGLSQPCTLAFENQSVLSDSLGLRNWTISDNQIGHVVPPIDNQVCCIRPKIPLSLQSRGTDSNFRYYSLRRPGTTNCAAIVQVEESGALILNPKGFNYGPIPELNKITPIQAEELWGTRIPHHFKAKPLRTYKLKAHDDLSNSNFFIDLVFKNNRIEEYRVRTSQNDSADWQRVL